MGPQGAEEYAELRRRSRSVNLWRRSQQDHDCAAAYLTIAEVEGRAGRTACGSNYHLVIEIGRRQAPCLRRRTHRNCTCAEQLRASIDDVITTIDIHHALPVMSLGAVKREERRRRAHIVDAHKACASAALGLRLVHQLVRIRDTRRGGALPAAPGEIAWETRMPFGPTSAAM